MRYRVAVEDIEPGHYVCWVLDLPGCFSSAASQKEAVAGAPSSIADYYAWTRERDPALPRVTKPFEVDLVEVFEAHPCAGDPDYLVNAFFQDDRRPLSYWEVAVGLELLRWTRDDLLRVVGSLSTEELQRAVPGEDRRSIAGVLEHLAGAENWYLSQLDLAVERSSLPEGVLGKLVAVRANTRGQLVKLIGEGRITESCGERWSARKILRRTVWHERDHTEHIAKLVTRLYP
jgi:hypothetical protein